MPSIERYTDTSISRTYSHQDLMNDPDLLLFIKGFLATRFNSKEYYDTWMPNHEDNMVLFFSDENTRKVSLIFQYKFINGVYYIYALASPPAPHRIPGFARKSMINWLSLRKNSHIVLGIKADDPDIKRLATFYTGLGFTNPSITDVVGPYVYDFLQIRLIRYPHTPVSLPKNESIISSILILADRASRQ